jgi:LEA14-like dessication related protein
MKTRIITPIIIFAATMILSCATMNLNQRPTAEIVNFDIESLSLRGITLLFDVEIRNPYPIPLKLNAINSTFYIENKQLFKTSTASGMKIRGMGKEINRFKVNLKFADIAKIVQDYSSRESLECLVDMTIAIPLPDALKNIQKEITFNFKLKKEIPVIMPQISIKNFTVVKPTRKEIEAALAKARKKNLSASAVTSMFGAILDGENPAKVIDPSDLDLKLNISFDILMNNKTKTRMIFKDLNYDFIVNNSRLVDGYTDNIQNRSSQYILKVNNDFSSKALSKSILNAFSKGKGDYKLKGYSMVKFPDRIKKDPVKMTFDENGGFSIK